MKVVRCCDKHVHVVDVPAPQGEGVLVKVRSAGICGSDLHMVNAGYDIPSTLGHEVAGTLSDGRAVALEPILLSFATDKQGLTRVKDIRGEGG